MWPCLLREQSRHVELHQGGQGKKFDFDEVRNVLWFTIENTDDERRRSSKISYLMNTLGVSLAEK